MKYLRGRLSCIRVQLIRTVMLLCFLQCVCLTQDTTPKTSNTSTSSPPPAPDYAKYRQIYSLAGHEDQVLSVAFFPDESHIVTGGSDGKAMVWDLDSGKLTCTFARHQRNIVATAVFRSDGGPEAVTVGDNHVRVWEALTGKERCSFPYTGDVGTRILLSNNGLLCVTPEFYSLDPKQAPLQKSVVYDLTSGKALLPNLMKSDPMEVWLARDGALVYASMKDGTLWSWDVAKDHFIRKLKVPSVLDGFVLSQDEKWLVSTTNAPDGSSRTVIWDLEKDVSVGSFEGSISGPPVLSADKKLLLVEHALGTARIYNTATGTVMRDLHGKNECPITAACFDQSGTAALISWNDEDSTLRLYDLRTGREVNHCGDPKLTGVVVFGAMSPRDKYIAFFGTNENTPRIWAKAEK